MGGLTTYLIGAGASANVIPVVNNFVLGMEKFRSTVSNVRPGSYGKFKEPFEQLNIPIASAFDMYLKDLDWVIKEVQKHASIDTFARKLYLTNNSYRLRRLKAVIDVYLTATQLFDGIDTRYDGFFATIFRGGYGETIQLPRNLKIISWNYDFQFELAASAFYRKEKSTEVSDLLQTIPRSDLTYHDTLRFSIIKLNGTSGGYTLIEKGNLLYEKIEYNHSKYGKQLEEYDKIDILEFLMGVYIHNTMPGSNVTTAIHFSWEGKGLNGGFKEQAIRETRDTEYLVVIGYSFPTFNRDVDREIIQNMPKLKKVYIQVPEDSIDGVTQRFKAIDNKVEVVRMTSKEEFFIPFEYQPEIY